MSSQHNTIPDAGQFREWLKASMDLLGIKSFLLSRTAGQSPNTVRKFVTGEQAEIMVSTASSLSKAVRQLAAEKRVEVPAFDLSEVSDD